MMCSTRLSMLNAVRIGYFFVLSVLLLAGVAVRAEPIFGLTTTNSIVKFDSATPGTVSAPIIVTGIGAETLLDIDIRPEDGALYALSSAGNLYLIDMTTGAAILSATLTGVVLDPAATRFGIDFSPTVDRLRIVSNTGQNLRLTPGSSVTTIDSALNGAATGAVSVAYTNNDTDPATGTVLFYLGPSVPNTVFNSFNPNGGVLSIVGAMGVTSSQNVGFDISGLTDIAFASLQSPTSGGSSLYEINLTTGVASLVGSIDTGLALRGIAASPAAGTVPEPGTLSAIGLGLLVMLLGGRRRLSAGCSTGTATVPPV